MPARLFLAFRLAALLLFVALQSAPSWAADATDVERAAKRLRMQTYRQYRYDRREYDRRMEPVDRALASWRAKGAPASEAERLVGWIGSIEQEVRAAASTARRTPTSGRPGSSGRVAPQIPPRIPPRTTDAPDEPRETASSARPALPRQRTAAQAAPASPARVSKPRAATPAPPELQIAPSSSAINRSMQPSPPLDRAPPPRARLPRTPLPTQGSSTSPRAPILPPRREDRSQRLDHAVESSSAATLAQQSVKSLPPRAPASRGDKSSSAAIPPAVRSDAPHFALGVPTQSEIAGNLRLSAAAAATEIQAPQPVSRAFGRRPKPTAPQRLPSPASASRDPRLATQRLPAHRDDPRRQPSTRSLAAAPRALRKQAPHDAKRFPLPTRIPAIAPVDHLALPTASMIASIEPAEYLASRMPPEAPALRRVAPPSLPLPVSHAARPAHDNDRAPRWAVGHAQTPPAPVLDSLDPAATALVRRSDVGQDLSAWPTTTVALPLETSLAQINSLSPVAMSPQVQPWTLPIARIAPASLASTTLAAKRHADSLPEDVPTSSLALDRGRSLLLPRRESPGASYPTNVPGNPRLVAASTPRPPARPRTLLASTLVAVPRPPRAVAAAPQVPSLNRSDSVETVNVPMLSARIRSYNLSRAAVEDQLLANPVWDLNKMETIVASCSQLLQQYRFLRLYFDASRHGERASPSVLPSEEPASMDSLLQLVEDRCAARSSQLVVLDEVLEDEAMREERQRMDALARRIQSWSAEPLPRVAHDSNAGTD
jgi:hypothetical protein